MISSDKILTKISLVGESQTALIAWNEEGRWTSSKHWQSAHIEQMTNDKFRRIQSWNTVSQLLNVLNYLSKVKKKPNSISVLY